jgi:hypothetical protein
MMEGLEIRFEGACKSFGDVRAVCLTANHDLSWSAASIPSSALFSRTRSTAYLQTSLLRPSRPYSFLKSSNNFSLPTSSIRAEVARARDASASE